MTQKLTTTDYENINRASMVLRSINNKVRQNILGYIYDKEKVGVTELYKDLKLEQSVASLHLSILRKEGVVSTERNGKQVYYSINNNRITDIKKFVEDILS